MGWVGLICCAVAAYRLHGTPWFVPAVVVGAVNFFALGIMSNYADDDVTHRSYQGFIVLAHMASTVAGMGLLLLSFVR